ncbi:putative AMP-binding enzyme [Lineolata rhizophorae]|uniref:Putative AMP-binding enzyme n=1 Tax=Lineolata rhizophorae TaxID=578093 RepID=A0A6A6NV06_9PEZI|nr:putative AMP-binding enzyme [Lineolata rhizophorae]
MPFLAQEHMHIPTKDLLSWMFDDQAYGENKPVYIDAADPNRTICSRQAKSIIRKLAAGFKKAGLKKASIYYSMVFLGIVAAGGVFAGTNPSYTAYELEHAVRTAKIKMLVVEPELVSNALAAAKATGIPQSRIFIFNSRGQPVADGLQSWEALQQHGEVDWECWDDKVKSENTSVARLFSSGTTGLPKALDMSHYNFVAQHTLVMEYRPRDYVILRLLSNPMFHVSIVPRAHTSPLRGGYVTYVMRRFELEPYLRNIEVYQITEANMVPPMVIQIINSPLSTKYSFQSVRFAWVGAAPLDKEPQARLKAFLRDDTPFNQVWGMSETSCIATMLYYPEQDPTGSVGQFMPNLDAKLVDDDGHDITDYGVTGELCVRGPTVVKGYFDNEEANRRDWDEDGFFHTGDVAYRDPANKLWYIVDRKKDLIKVRGFQVSPAEIEGVLLRHRSIVDAAVIGVKFGRDGSEYPRAYVVLAKGARMTEKEVARFCNGRLARYKGLEGGVRFVEFIPKNASGKILKKKIRRWAERDLGAKL